MINSPKTQFYRTPPKRRVVRPEDIALSGGTDRFVQRMSSNRSPNSLAESMRSRLSTGEADFGYDFETIGDDSSVKSGLTIPRHSYKLPSDIPDTDTEGGSDSNSTHRSTNSIRSNGSRRSKPRTPNRENIQRFVNELEDRVSLDSGRLSRDNSKKGSSRSTNPKGTTSRSPSIGRSPRRTTPSMSSSVITFVGRKVGVKNIEKSLKDTFAKATEVLPKQGDMYSICEKYDTYVKGGLYPLLHISKEERTIDRIREKEEALDVDVLGSSMVVDQAVYKEVAAVTYPDDFSSSASVLTVAAFRSVDKHPKEDLVNNWKSWTGARAYMIDIAEAGLLCRKMSFYVREHPLLTEEDHKGFYYLLICEMVIRDPSDEGLVTDVLQRFRVERWFGYQTIYRNYRK